MSIETPATLSEKQLFNKFADGDAIVRGRTGKVKQTIPVKDLFGGVGEVENFTAVMPDILDNIRGSDEPAWELQMLLDTLHGMVADVALAHDEFDRCLREARAVEGEAA
ncbi:hypothetical protein [Devosia sp. SL43]|uniref:hypothetical protein n=1 Tax=Devosia sp. SL43 TaxID=2806348 RepID=UPI001F26D4FD|nr:hypothetical protein [Devosia sp. SL43]UJW85772.1 hypothetical protein IM737_00235 [Devosia sp. SL43]